MAFEATPSRVNAVPKLCALLDVCFTVLTAELTALSVPKIALISAINVLTPYSGSFFTIGSLNKILVPASDVFISLTRQ